VIIDRVSVSLVAGKGGDGGASFSRRRRIATADGGDGGKGGDVVFSADPNLYDLSKFRKSKRYKASNGTSGTSQRKHGKNGEDLYLYVPCGTMIRQTDDLLLADLVGAGDRVIVLSGGRGGLGNYQRGQAEAGLPGQKKDVVLDYRIPNDVAFVGFANTGRTSLVNALSGQSYPVAAYPFTTVHCLWAVCEHRFKRFTVLDTPPVTAHDDLREAVFLKHLHRTRIIMILSDNPDEMRAQQRIIEEKIGQVDPSYRKKKFFYLYTKVDTIKGDSPAGREVPVSLQKPETIDRLIDLILKELYS